LQRSITLVRADHRSLTLINRCRAGPGQQEFGNTGAKQNGAGKSRAVKNH
jgi:hypothetical protein